MTALPRSCIIGAGCSGFTTAKALQDRGLPFDLFEATGAIGGTWNYNNPGSASACYQSLHIDTSKTRMQFEDFPIPANYPDYPHHAQILEPVVLKWWKVETLQNLTAEAEAARDALLRQITRIGELARRIAERAREAKERAKVKLVDKLSGLSTE